MNPTRICYLEIPSADPGLSARFYEKAFGWRIRERGDGALAFDDAAQVSGSWVTGRPAMTEPGLMVYIMVDDAAEAVEAVVAAGGTIVRALGADSPEITARFADPYGNVLGIYQEPDERGGE
jgi:hypothetical protein